MSPTANQLQIDLDLCMTAIENTRKLLSNECMPTTMIISTMTVTCQTFATSINIPLLRNKHADFFDNSIEISTKGSRFKNCAILRVPFSSENHNNSRKIAINVFKSGAFNFTGIRDFRETSIVADNLLKAMWQHGVIGEVGDNTADFPDEPIMSTQLRMLNTVFGMPFDINLPVLHQVIRERFPTSISKYNPESHPGVQLKIHDTSVFMFASGKIIVAGCKDFVKMISTYQTIVGFVNDTFERYSRHKVVEVKVKAKRGRKRKADAAIMFGDLFA
jgi:TATA-box binding protein (TBP) (component of TFIID and TFIIIB)